MYIYSPLRFTVLSFIAAAGTLVAADDWNVVDHIPFSKLTVQSHRGAGTLAPENTIQAFELGWKLGTVPEADLRYTKDGVIVAFHDADFKRLVKDLPKHLEGKKIAEVPYEEVAKLDVGPWMGEEYKGYRVPKISEVFDVMKDRPDRRLYLDIKAKDLDLKQLAKEVKAAGVGKQVILATKHHDLIREWKSLVPESETLLWMRAKESDTETATESLHRQVGALEDKGFEGITQLQIHIFPNKDSNSDEPYTLTREDIRNLGQKLRSRNILFQALPYMPDRDVYGKLMDLGLASFATDYPDVTMNELKEYYQKRGH